MSWRRNPSRTATGAVAIEPLEPRTLMSVPAALWPQMQSALKVAGGGGLDAGMANGSLTELPMSPNPVLAPAAPGAQDSGPRAAPMLDSSWHLVFADEFNSAPASPTWVYRIWGGRTTGQTEWSTYARRAVTVSGGVLSLTAAPASSTHYISGMINTGGLAGVQGPGFSFRYGYAEARIRVPAGRGLWPAFWMLPQPTPSGEYRDDAGEIDVMELRGQRPGVVEVHLKQSGQRQGRIVRTGVNLSQDFHTYGVAWARGQMQWYLDGVRIYSYVGRTPRVPEYLILNLAVGGPDSWSGAPDRTTQFTARMDVDYVRVWQQ